MPLLAVVFQIISTCAAHRDLEWTDLARGPASPRSPSRNGCAGFFPLPRSGGIPREAKKPSDAVLRCAAGLTAAGRSLPGRRTAIEAAMVAARQQNGDHHGYHRNLHRRRTTASPASVKTLTLNVKAKFVATEKDNDKAPDYRIFAGATEFGAAWKKTARETRSRISLGQARRSELPGPDLRLAGEGRGRRQLHADLVPPQRRLIQPDRRAPPLRRRGFFCAHGRNADQEYGDAGPSDLASFAHRSDR